MSLFDVSTEIVRLHNQGKTEELYEFLIDNQTSLKGMALDCAISAVLLVKEHVLQHKSFFEQFLKAIDGVVSKSFTTNLRIEYMKELALECGINI